MALNAFFAANTGMEAQSQALSTIAGNIANINTTGYKTNQTMFYTLLGSQPVVKSNASGLHSSRADINGVGYYDRTNILDQGVVTATGGNFDAAISGDDNAFFTLKDEYNNTYYTRAGDFETRTENGVTYLIASNGYKVQGFPALDGGDVFGAGIEDIIIKYPEVLPPQPTTEAKITANVPATGVDSASYSITVYAPNHNGETLNMIFKKVEGMDNTWDLSFSVEGGTATGSETRVRFDARGELISPKTLNVDIAWDDGDTNNIALNLTNMTQLAGGPGTTYVEQDGKESGNYLKSYIDKDGVVKAYYNNGESYNFGKLALTGFSAPENLTPVSGTLFEANGTTGEAFFLSDNGVIQPQALERSATDIEVEFGEMIKVQRAYSANTQTFQAANEMLQILYDLKA